LKDHPESLAKLPPAIVLNGKFEDGAHRVSAIWLLQQRMDPKNPLWKNAKLNVQFVKQGVAEGQDDNGISFQIQKGKNKFATTITVNNEQVGVYQYDANTGRSVAEVYPEFKGKGLGKLLVLHAIYTAEQLGLNFQEDESRTSDYDNVLDSLSSNGYIVDDDGYWYVTGEGEQYLKQSLKQGVAENFADGKGPGRPGDSVRHGIPKHATMAELEKASHSKGRKGQLARWQLNMRRGKKK
jgi:GNAT superfamily N-acetyltransferase